MKHSILFTGHMIDDKNRDIPRFPAKKEGFVKREILKQLLEEEKSTNKPLTGIAGGACGGDIIFHEACEELGISTEMFLALPLEEYKKNSVSFAGPDWDIRFDRLVKKLTVHILPVDKRNGAMDNIWTGTNLWMLNHVFEIEEKNVTLIALWDCKDGDGAGGTEHMIKTAKKKGAKINIININKI